MARKSKIQKRLDELKELAAAENWEALEEAANKFIEDYEDRAEGYFYRGSAKLILEKYEALEKITNKTP